MLNMIFEPGMLKELRVLVIGDIMLDKYLYGLCERISPEAPVPIVDVQVEKSMLGGAANVVNNLNSLGINAGIVGVIGNDKAGELVMELLDSNLHLSYIIKDSQRKTTVKSRVMVNGHQMLRFDHESKLEIRVDIEFKLVTWLEANLELYDVVLISDYSKGLLTDNFLKSVISLCRAHKRLVIVDPKGNNFVKYKGVNIIKPNKKEASEAVGRSIRDNEDLKSVSEELFHTLELDSLIITLSEDGIMYHDKGGMHIIPTDVRDVFDVSGAGDTVLASLGMCLGLGMSLSEACIFSNQAAAIVVSKPGSASTTIEEIMNYQMSTTF